MTRTIPVSAIVATRDRAQSLARTFESLLSQDVLPTEYIVVDASGNDATKSFLSEFEKRVRPAASVQWTAAAAPGAAPQRNQGFGLATQPFIWFFDDDIRFEPKCVSRLWVAIESDPAVGGVSAMIVNQRYQPPRLVSRSLFTVMNGGREKTFAGRVIGPAINLLPEDRQDLPEIVPVEWLNTTCTLYRREALPDPAFPRRFAGYSLMEDVTLSLNIVKRGWKLANARTAGIFHDSQPGVHKADVAAISAMELTNRHYVMTNVLGRRGFTDHLKLGVYELFQIAATIRQNPRTLGRVLRGKVAGLREILGMSRRADAGGYE